MDHILRQAGNSIRLLTIAALAVLLSLGLYEAWELEIRWFILVVVGIAAIGISLCFVRFFSDLLLSALLFCIPIVTFSKWFLFEDIYAGAFGIGPIDLLICGLYATWFYRVFVIRRQPPPRLTGLDVLVIWLILAHALSTLGSWEPSYGVGATAFVVKYALIYFYVSRHLDERLLPWLLAAFAFTALAEVVLSVYQFTTGQLVGIALDRGAGGSQINTQYHVPGTGSYYRASGTCYDAHSLGHLMALIAPFPIALLLTPNLRLRLRLVCMAIAGAALLTVVLTLSRSAWYACALGLGFGTLLMLLVWRERETIVALAAAVFAVVLVAPFVSDIVYDRIANAPHDVISVRFNQYAVGWQVIMLYPIFGVGPGNWMQAFRLYDFTGMELLPLHNVILYILVEIGAFGLLAYLSVIAVASWRIFRSALRRRDIPGRLAMAAIISLMTFMLNGLTDPTFREPNVYFMFWLLVSLSVVLPPLRPGALGTLLMSSSNRYPPISTAAGHAGAAATGN